MYGLEVQDKNVFFSEHNRRLSNEMSLLSEAVSFDVSSKRWRGRVREDTLSEQSVIRAHFRIQITHHDHKPLANCERVVVHKRPLFAWDYTILLNLIRNLAAKILSEAGS